MAPLGCGIMTGAGAVLRDMAIGPSQSLAVFGVGAVGLSAVMAAALSGAAPIVAVDIDRSRLELAASLGATVTLHPDDGDVVEAIRDASHGGVDFSLNTTSTSPVFSQAAACLGVRGMAVYVAPGGVEWTPNLNEMMGRGVKLQGIIQGSASARTHVPVLVDAMRRGRLPVQRLIRTYPFADFAQAFDDAVHARTIKPVLLMDS
jgi:aryl-alcohol dehydrogenase